VAAVLGLCNELGRHHALKVDFTHTGVPRILPPAAALCLYRIAQEALRNVARHSGTDRAAVGLIGSPTGVRLVVADGGVGFDLATPRPNGGLGLISMRERVHLVGGELTIDARPAGGTRIDVRVPAPVPPTAAAELEAADRPSSRQKPRAANGSRLPSCACAGRCTHSAVGLLT
jgi:signal transduction histidine kinase